MNGVPDVVIYAILILILILKPIGVISGGSTELRYHNPLSQCREEFSESKVVDKQ